MPKAPNRYTCRGRCRWPYDKKDVPCFTFPADPVSLKTSPEPSSIPPLDRASAITKQEGVTLATVKVDPSTQDEPWYPEYQQSSVHIEGKYLGFCQQLSASDSDRVRFVFVGEYDWGAMQGISHIGGKKYIGVRNNFPITNTSGSQDLLNESVPKSLMAVELRLEEWERLTENWLVDWVNERILTLQKAFSGMCPIAYISFKPEIDGESIDREYRTPLFGNNWITVTHIPDEVVIGLREIIDPIDPMEGEEYTIGTAVFLNVGEWKALVQCAPDIKKFLAQL